MEPGEALDALRTAFVQGAEQIVVVGSKSFSFADFGAGYDFEAAVGEAVSFSESSGFFANLRKKRALREEPLHIHAEFTWDGEIVQSLVEGMAKSAQKSPVEPTYSLERGKFVIVPGQKGASLDQAAVVAGIEGLLAARKGGEVKVSMVQIAPKFDDADFERATQLMGTFSTPFDPSNPARARNITVASGYLDNQVILPGETLSVCAVLRPRVLENGYVEAGQIIGGVPDSGIGGGICQISSTLYMAALYAEMEIVQRQAHSLMVGYMQPATDATIAEGLIDLKLKNNTDYPMLIQSTLRGRSHTVNIFGFDARPKERHIRFESELVQINPFETKFEECPLLPPGAKMIAYGVDGAKYTLYKIITKDGVEEKVKINTSNYRPLHEIIKTGVAR